MTISELVTAFESAQSSLTNDNSALANSQVKLAAAQVDVTVKTSAVAADIPILKQTGADLIAGIQQAIDAATAPPTLPPTV